MLLGFFNQRHPSTVRLDSPDEFVLQLCFYKVKCSTGERRTLKYYKNSDFVNRISQQPEFIKIYSTEQHLYEIGDTIV
jgi:hypothetical protein